MTDPNYEDPPEPKLDCDYCGTKLKTGRCYYCEGEYNNDDEVDRRTETRKDK